MLVVKVSGGSSNIIDVYETKLNDVAFSVSAYLASIDHLKFPFKCSDSQPK